MKAYAVAFLPLVLFSTLEFFPHLPGLPDPATGARTTWYFIYQDLNDGVIALICLLFGAIGAYQLRKSQPKESFMVLFVITLFMSMFIVKLPWIFANTDGLFSASPELIPRWSEPEGYIGDIGKRISSLLTMLVIAFGYLSFRKRYIDRLPG